MRNTGRKGLHLLTLNTTLPCCCRTPNMLLLNLKMSHHGPSPLPQVLDVGREDLLANAFAEASVLDALRGWPGSVQMLACGRAAERDCAASSSTVGGAGSTGSSAGGAGSSQGGASGGGSAGGNSTSRGSSGSVQLVLQRCDCDLRRWAEEHPLRGQGGQEWGHTALRWVQVLLAGAFSGPRKAEKDDDTALGFRGMEVAGRVRKQEGCVGPAGHIRAGINSGWEVIRGWAVRRAGEGITCGIAFTPMP